MEGEGKEKLFSEEAVRKEVQNSAIGLEERLWKREK